MEPRDKHSSGRVGVQGLRRLTNGVDFVDVESLEEFAPAGPFAPLAAWLELPSCHLNRGR